MNRHTPGPWHLVLCVNELDPVDENCCSIEEQLTLLIARIEGDR